MVNRKQEHAATRISKVGEHRVSYLVGSRLKDRKRIHKAIKMQDEIRKRHPAPQAWKSADEIRKWREKE